MYCVTVDVRARLPEVTSEFVSDTTLADVIQHQSEMIDNILRRSYTVPFTTVPLTIVDLCIDKSVYKVMQTFPDANFDDDLVRLGSDIRELEDDLLSGRITLDESITDDATTGNTSAPYFTMVTTVVDSDDGFY